MIKHIAHVREDFKYYLADFVCKRVPPPPFTDKIFGKKGVADLGGTPHPPFTDKISSEKGVTDLGGTPPPFTDKNRKVAFKVFP